MEENKHNSEDYSKALQSYIDEWVASFKHNVQTQMSREFFRAVFSGSPIVEQFNSWLLAGIGATIALTIANLHNITGFIQAERLKYAISILVIGALFGFLSKIKAVRVNMVILLDQYLTAALNRIHKENEADEAKIELAAEQHGVHADVDVNMQETFAPFIESMPWFTRKRLIRNFNRGAQDPLVTYKDTSKVYYWQMTNAFAQVLCVVVFVLMIVFSIKMPSAI